MLIRQWFARSARLSLFKIPIYRQLETHRLTHFPRLLDIWRCQVPATRFTWAGRPYMPAGKVLERIQRASSFPSSLLPFISSS